MKVAIFVNEFPRTTLTFIVHKVRALAQRGVNVTVVSFGRPKNPPHMEFLRNLKGVKIVYIPKMTGSRLRRSIAWIVAFFKALLKSPRSTYKCWVLTHHYNPLQVRLQQMGKLLNLVGLQGDIYHFEFSIIAVNYIDYFRSVAPSVVSFRGADIDVYPHHREGLDDLYKEIVKYADRIHCVSQIHANKVARLGGRHKTFVNYPSIDTSFFTPDNTISRNPNLIVTVARLKWVKGLPYALLAISKLVSDFPDLCYVIVGEGPGEDELLYYIKDLGIQKNVVLYRRATVEQVKNLLQEASIYLLSSLSEGISNAVLEAMAMEVPVVATAAGGMIEAINDGVDGVVVPRYDPDSIAMKIRALLTDEAFRKKLGQNARRRVLSDFTIEHQAQVFFEEYCAILQRQCDE